MSNLEKFIIKANKIHNNKYNYQKFQYVNAKTASIIICPIHGEHFKIGITKDLKNRINGIKYKGKKTIKNIEILYTYEDTLENVFYLEQDILNMFSKYRITLDYSTELFNKDISNYNFFKKIFNN